MLPARLLCVSGSRLLMTNAVIRVKDLEDCSICHTKLLFWHVQEAQLHQFETEIKLSLSKRTQKYSAAQAADGFLTSTISAVVESVVFNAAIKHAVCGSRGRCWHAAGLGDPPVRCSPQCVLCVIPGIPSSLSISLWDPFYIKIDTCGRTQWAALFLRERRACASLVPHLQCTNSTFSLWLRSRVMHGWLPPRCLEVVGKGQGVGVASVSGRTGLSPAQPGGGRWGWRGSLL